MLVNFPKKNCEIENDVDSVVNIWTKYFNEINNRHCPTITKRINPLNADPEYTRGQKMSPCRGPRVYSGAECVFLYFCL